MSLLAEHSIHAWILENGIKNEKGDPITFRDHPFLFDMYRDFSPLQAVMKAAQIGASVMMNIKPYWLMAKKKMDVIYTLPTDGDIVSFVSGKTNRIIAQNPALQLLTKDKDSIEQKYVGNGVIYYNGTWTKKAAMMTTADLLIHDEVDASKLPIIADYETRIKHSKFKWRWYFSHPSTEGAGVHKYWAESDQKHWFVRCPFCKKEQFMSWPESVCMERGIYICKECEGQIGDSDRRKGRWVNKYADRPFSGYWVPSMICPWVPASEIIQNFREHDIEYFTTKVMGLPYVGAGNKLTWELFKNNIVDKVFSEEERIVIGVDTGVKIDMVAGNAQGIFYHNRSDDYEELEKLLSRWPRAICVIDQGGDLILPRKLREKYPGRVFLCHFRRDRKTMALITWGEGEEFGNVVVDRNRMIQLLVDEFTERRIPVLGTSYDWKPYWEHWGNMYRVREEDTLGVMRSEWKRSGPDHLALATVYWRVGMSKFGVGIGEVLGAKSIVPKVGKGVELSPNRDVPAKNVYIFPKKEASPLH